MATRASSKKDPTQKSVPKADQPPNKTAPPSRTTDLISPAKKKPAVETRQTRSAVPPISKANQPAPAPAPSAAPAPAAQTPPPPPPKPETVSLIDENKSKRSEES